ncbi:hypothetical protein CL629_03570 [bacterium]|nr:hypothetical protein [bacterium]|tara:strand:- start:3782 stop:4069 length:288 start_codon:yes stop_codon:yes gene_type:complete
MGQSSTSTIVVAVVIALIVGGVGGYLYGKSAGQTAGYDTGYTEAEEDLVKVQEEAARRTTEEAAKAANPFEIENPLENVEANPFEKVKEVLNPFE